jgi:hypothetical protein
MEPQINHPPVITINKYIGGMVSIPRKMGGKNMALFYPHQH